jgi:hypothetical protein
MLSLQTQDILTSLACLFSSGPVTIPFYIVEDEITFLPHWTKPDADVLRVPIDIPHLANPVIALCDIRLADTNSTSSETDLFFLFADSLQCFEKARLYHERLPI